MKNPNFLVLDEPTNDLDIQTSQIFEDYLSDFPGCVIVVSHDRYFMDKVVDHLLVFKGNGVVTDFPGNYTQYREWCSLKSKEEETAKDINTNTRRIRTAPERRRMTFKEKQEFAALEKEIAALETEREKLETELCSGNLDVEALTEKSKRLPVIKDELDIKEMRWLELSEIES